MQPTRQPGVTLSEYRLIYNPKNPNMMIRNRKKMAGNRIRLARVMVAILAILVSACGKEFLSVKSDQKLRIPGSLQDYQALLDRVPSINLNSCHELGVIGSDEYYVLDGRLQTLPNPYQRNAYIWADNVYEDNPLDDWNNAYYRIYLANLVLDGLQLLDDEGHGTVLFRQIRGSALFLRAFNHYQLAQLFCKPYDAGASRQDPGIPLRLESDITMKSSRANVEETYRQIIHDLEEAARLLPFQPEVTRRPSGQAAYALLSKTCLLMGLYSEANDWANRCLETGVRLLDFNEMNLGARYPFPQNGIGNDEVMFHCSMKNATITGSTRINIDTVLLAGYAAHDLRKQAYFFHNTDGRIIFKGSYHGSVAFFTGIASDEVLLIRAETYARLGDITHALADLNLLMRHRMEKAAFIPYQTDNAAVALSMILAERRKELVLRGVRWEDLRRLNKMAGYEKTLVRNIDGQEYRLPPNSNRYVWPLPDNVIALSGMEQNAR